MSRWVIAIGVFALTLSACTIQETGRADSIVADSLGAVERRRAEDVRLAIDVAHELRQAPERAEVILREHGLSRAELDSLLYRVAGDSALSAVYDRGLAAASDGEVH
ncbi:MAG TPA: hypothetical protein VMM18_00800 [Gemmatimonadaceae bacterium]|nr:hypothetical protein [Gemmatimonadaceae bacterium]